MEELVWALIVDVETNAGGCRGRHFGNLTEHVTPHALEMLLDDG